MKYVELLSQQDIEKIHENVLYILANIGIKFNYEPAIDILKKHGCTEENGIVCFSKEIVEKYLAFAPKEFKLYGREDRYDVTFNMESFITIPCYGSPYVHHHGEERREGLYHDYVKFTKLAQSSEHLDMASAVPCEMYDIPLEIQDAEYIRTLLLHCEKPFVVSKTAHAMKSAFDQCALLYGGKEAVIEKPRFISITDSLCPLSYDETMLKLLIFCAEHGIPQRIGGFGTGGLTTPVTWAGNLSQMMAESLAGIVLTQMIRQGAPVVINNSSSSADMRSLGLTVGAAESAINCIGTVQMGHFYGLPVRSGGGISDSKLVDAQAGAEGMMNLLTSAYSGANYILHAAGILEAYMVSSLEKFMIDEENCALVKHIRKGIAVNEETLAREAIKEVGAGGSYLLHEHTFTNYTSLYQPNVYDRLDWQHWVDNGSKDCVTRAKEAWEKRIAEFEMPKLSASDVAQLDNFVKNYKV